MNIFFEGLENWIRNPLCPCADGF